MVSETLVDTILETLDAYREKDRRRRKKMERALTEEAEKVGLGPIVRDLIKDYKKGAIFTDLSSEKDSRPLAEALARVSLAKVACGVANGMVPDPNLAVLVLDQPDGRGANQPITFMATDLVPDRQMAEAQVLGFATTWGMSSWRKLRGMVLVFTDARVKIGLPGKTGFDGLGRIVYGWEEEDGTVECRLISRSFLVKEDEEPEFGKLEVTKNPDERLCTLVRASFQINKAARLVTKPRP